MKTGVGRGDRRLQWHREYWGVFLFGSAPGLWLDMPLCAMSLVLHMQNEDAESPTGRYPNQLPPEGSGNDTPELQNRLLDPSPGSSPRIGVCRWLISSPYEDQVSWAEEWPPG